MSEILITGATGHLGKMVVKTLIDKINPESIHVLVRKSDQADAFHDLSEQIQVHIGDYDDYSSLVSAFRGIDKLYFVSSSDLHNRVRQHDNVLNAAKVAGVKQVVYTSFQRKSDSDFSPIAFITKAHFHTEQALATSGMTYTLLQHGLYMEYIPDFAGVHVLENYTIYLPAGDGKIAYVTRADLAEAAANILLDETGSYNNKSVVLTGAEALSWEQIARIITEITGSLIAYVPAELEEFKSKLEEAMVPAEIISLLTLFSTAGKDGQFDTVSDDLEKVLGHTPETVKTYLERFYSKI